MAISAATTGASTAGRTILFSTASKWIACTPPATQAAPMRPPKSACEELEGSPRYQVTRFHRMAPISPAKITTGLMSASSTRPPEMVLATWTDRKAPATFRHAATATAVLGRNAPVAMDVAMALAVSWKPLVKSKTNAVTTTATTISDTSMDRALHSTDRNPAGRCRPRCRCAERRERAPPTVPSGSPRGAVPSRPYGVAERPHATWGLGGERWSRVRRRRVRDGWSPGFAPDHGRRNPPDRDRNEDRGQHDV